MFHPEQLSCKYDRFIPLAKKIVYKYILIMRLFLTICIFLVVPFVAFGLVSDQCVVWFFEADLSPKIDDCELKCTVTPVDMGNFSCTNECEDLCQTNLLDHFLKYSSRLTEGDKVVISKYPLEALRVYKSKGEVEQLTSKIFGVLRAHDESDAFRHFIWSGLLTKEFGDEKAKIFLDAHEKDSTQSAAAKQMDLDNNSLGQKFVKGEKAAGREIDMSVLEKKGLELLRTKKLKVLESKHSVIPKGYYSE